MPQYHTPVLPKSSGPARYTSRRDLRRPDVRRRPFAPHSRAAGACGAALRLRSGPRHAGQPSRRRAVLLRGEQLPLSARSVALPRGPGGGRHSGRSGRLVAPFRRRGARFLVPRGRAARHAHEPAGAAHGGGRGERLLPRRVTRLLGGLRRGTERAVEVALVPRPGA